MTLIKQLWPGQSCIRLPFLLFVFWLSVFLKQTLLDFKCMHTQMSSCGIHTFRGSGLCYEVWLGGFSPYGINQEAICAACRVCQGDARRILGSSSPRVSSGSLTHCEIKEEKWADHPSPPDSTTLVFFLVETLLNIECPVNWHTAFIIAKTFSFYA